MSESDVLRALAGTAAIYGKDLTEAAVQILAMDLADYPTRGVLGALARCRKELRTFPTVADIIARIEDGRPGAEEAWAMLPKDEGSSVVWTREMAEAFGVVRHMVGVDPIAARMAFKETYSKLLVEARSERRPIAWLPSFGRDVSSREAAIQEAVDKRRLLLGQAQAFLPSAVPRSVLAIEDLHAEEGSGVTQEEIEKYITQIKTSLGAMEMPK